MTKTEKKIHDLSLRKNVLVKKILKISRSKAKKIDENIFSLQSSYKQRSKELHKLLQNLERLMFLDARLVMTPIDMRTIQGNQIRAIFRMVEDDIEQVKKIFERTSERLSDMIKLCADEHRDRIEKERKVSY